MSSSVDRMEVSLSCLPLYARGPVVRGFGRGSKELGIPTANFPEDVVSCLPQSISCGVYYGWARVDEGPIQEMVMSIGWNPQYMNDKKSMETHILHEFPEDFYGATLEVCVAGYIRPEKQFVSIDELVREIKNDIAVARERLSSSHMLALAEQFSTHFKHSPIENQQQQ